MGKQYTTAPILVNSNGDPIPQYLDITDKTDSPQGTFKPLTNETIHKVQLTGSIVGEQKIATDLIVTVGSKTTIATLDTSNYKKVGLRVQRKDTSGDSAQNIAFHMQLGFTGILYMDGFDVKIPLINERTSMLNYRAITMMVEVDAPEIVFKLENKGNSDHIYDVWLVYKTR